MSKHKQPTAESLEALAELQAHEPAPPIPSVQVPIGECQGKMIECPICGKPAEVTHARGARTATQVITSRFWVLVKCKGFCGSRLEKIGTKVTLMPESMPQPVYKPLGQAVGHFILCPKCHAKALARWTLDDGHVVNCPTCGIYAQDGQTSVEVVS